MEWIFESIIKWVAGMTTQLMDAVSGLFLDALGTDMTAMEEYFPFVTSAFEILKYMAWSVLFLITVWQLFRAFGGPITEAENPLLLCMRSAIFAVLIGYAKPVFLIALTLARAPYTALMEISAFDESFTFVGIEQALNSGLITIVSNFTVVGPLLILILMISIGWNYFKLLLETVERYVVAGILCYTSPLAFAMGGSKSTNQVFKSWCRMVGSQLLLLVMNVWFLRAFASSVGQYIGNGGAISNGHGSIFLWLFCALAFLKTAQRADSFLASVGMNTAQTGSNMGMELLMAARVVSGIATGHSAGSLFKNGTAQTGIAAASTGFTAGFADKFKPQSYVRDAVVNGGSRMGMGGSLGFVNRIFGGIAARNGAVLSGNSIASVAGKPENISGTIAGDIADRSLNNYMPQMNGFKLSGTQISGGRISTTAAGTDGKLSNVELYSTAQYEKPANAHSVVTASDGSSWYQIATGDGKNAFYSTPDFTGASGEASKYAAAFPDITPDVTLRTVNDGVIEASAANGNTLWYSSAVFEEPSAPHEVIHSSDGIDWYMMKQHGEIPDFEVQSEAAEYNTALFRDFLPGYDRLISSVDDSQRDQGYFEVLHPDGTGAEFFDASQYETPNGGYTLYEDQNGNQWIAVTGDSAVAVKPVYIDGEPVYDGDNVKTVKVETVHYHNTPHRYHDPEVHSDNSYRPVRRK